MNICVDTCETWNTYNEYLKTNHWIKFKTQYAKTHPKVCNMCYGTKYIELHHITYERIGNESDTDVVWLCRKCHKLIHSIPNKNERISTGRFILDTKKERAKKRKREPIIHIKDTPKQPRPPKSNARAVDVPSWYKVK